MTMKDRNTIAFIGSKVGATTHCTGFRLRKPYISMMKQKPALP